MSVDHLQLQVSDVVYNNTTWLPESSVSEHTDVYDALEDFNTAMEAISGLVKDGAVIQSTDTSGSDNMQMEGKNPVYGGLKYIASTDASTLRTNMIAQLVAISAYLNSYKDVMVRSYRNDLQASDGYMFGTGADNEGLEIYISGCKFLTALYVEPDNIDLFLSRINNALDSIANLEFSGIVASSTKAFTDQIFIGVDDASYTGLKYIDLTNATTLRNAVINALQSVTDLDTSLMEVEIRVARKDNLSSD
jgi:hypothetical protein